MSRTQYSATMSLFIAGPGGDMQWLRPHLTNPVAEALVQRIGSLLVGARTYRGDDPNRGTDAEGAFGGTWAGPTFVLTHHPECSADPDLTFVADLETGVAAAREAAATATSTSWAPTSPGSAWPPVSSTRCS